MLNKDYYKDSILKLAFRGQDIAVVDGEPKACINTSCAKCALHGAATSCREARWDWANSEYEEKVDWTKVKCDTPILVKTTPNEAWHRRYFAKYEDGRVYTWDGGCTSWSASTTGFWQYAKLAPLPLKTETN